MCENLSTSKKQRPSWEANRSLSSQEILLNLLNPKVHHRIHKNRPHVPVLSQIDPVHIPHPTFRKSILISSHLGLGLPSGSFPQVSPPKSSMHLYSPPHVLYALPTLITLKKGQLDRVWCWQMQKPAIEISRSSKLNEIKLRYFNSSGLWQWRVIHRHNLFRTLSIA